MAAVVGESASFLPNPNGRNCLVETLMNHVFGLGLTDGQRQQVMEPLNGSLIKG
jgi:hypothetical protein